MKRSPSTSIPELSSPPRRKRALSEEERALWESVAKQTKPLRKRSRAAKPQLAAPDSETQVAAKAAAAPKAHPPAKVLRAPRPEVTPAAPPLAPLGRRERSQLSRGRKEIDARLDLHGMTQTRAHRALAGFLQRAHSDGLTFVLIITGKGRTIGRESERGVLRRQVPQWLSLPEFRSLVVGFEEAHIGHGGEGALYVRIRRSRM
jgi:DNA-nicking Smr family endonuclease